MKASLTIVFINRLKDGLMIPIRELTDEQQDLMLDLDLALDKKFGRENPYSNCAICGGYMQANRPAEDVDIFLHLPDNYNNESLTEVYKALGFNIVEECVYHEYGGILMVRVTHEVFDNLPIQILGRATIIIDQIEEEFPLSIQQVAWLPNDGGVYTSSSYEENTPKKVIVVHHKAEKFIDKYMKYYPNWIFDYSSIKLPALSELDL